MSDYTIRLTPSELRQRATDIDDNADIVKREVDKISQEVNNLRPTFIGVTASNFLKQYDDAHADMEEWDKIVRQFADLLNLAANNLQKADQG